MESAETGMSRGCFKLSGRSSIARELGTGILRYNDAFGTRCKEGMTQPTVRNGVDYKVSMQSRNVE